jgi:hypothetical protein
MSRRGILATITAVWALQAARCWLDGDWFPLALLVSATLGGLGLGYVHARWVRR